MVFARLQLFRHCIALDFKSLLEFERIRSFLGFIWQASFALYTSAVAGF